ncbi:MAG: hypothetical protein F4X12_20215 [Acidobacteriia bacterium]|nr:hypothetical protein [Terriglobia bacterium]
MFPADKAEELALRLFDLAGELLDQCGDPPSTFEKDILETVYGLAVGWKERVAELGQEHLPQKRTRPYQYNCLNCGPFDINPQLRCPTCGAFGDISQN